jgi:polar amino acid transport system substrate-binding protein
MLYILTLKLIHRQAAALAGPANRLRQAERHPGRIEFRVDLAIIRRMNQSPFFDRYVSVILTLCFALWLLPAHAQPVAEVPGAGAQLAASSAAGPPAAGQIAAPVRVAVYVNPPFVMETNGVFSGLAIDIWQDAAAKLGLTYNYVAMPTVPDMLQAVAAGQVDIAVADITITQARMQRLDFTQPWFNSGLRVMIDQDRQNRLGTVIRNLYKGGHLHVFMWLGLVIIAAVFALTLIDRRYTEDFPKKWSEGLIESLYHVLSVVTSGKSSHKLLFGMYGRLVASFWLLCGLAVVAYITSSITAVMTVASLNDQIHSAADLHGNPVGAVEGTVAEAWCLDAGLQTQGFANLPDAVHALVRRQIVGIVGDSASLEYYDNSHPELPITEVGAVFEPATEGFAMPIGSELGRAISVQIVAQMEDGTLTQMTARYFGIEP